jgi:hypothetical protein
MVHTMVHLHGAVFQEGGKIQKQMYGVSAIGEEQ